MGGKSLRKSFIATFAARGIDDVVTLTMRFDHLYDDFGRVLQIGIHRNNHVAARSFEAGNQTKLMAEVARKIDAYGIRVATAVIRH